VQRGRDATAARRDRAGDQYNVSVESVWNAELGWASDDVRVFCAPGSRYPRDLVDVLVVDLSGLGRVGRVSVPATPQVPTMGPMPRGRKPTKAQWAAHEAQKIEAGRAADMATAALEGFQAALRGIHGMTGWTQVWARVQGAAEAANRGIQGPARFLIDGAATLQTPAEERLRKPAGLEHNSEELRGQGFVLSYSWPSVSLRMWDGRDVAIRTGAAGKYAVGTMFARWVDEHAAALPGMDLAALRMGLRAARVPVDFALPGER
jgi:hypothetical protein